MCFGNLPPLDGIFKGISSLNREAGKEETEEFLKNGFITLGKDFSAEHVKQANRKTIAMEVNVMKKCDKKKRGLS